MITLFFCVRWTCVCVCVCVCVLTSWFWLGTGSVSPNRTLLCLCAGVRGWRGSSFSPAVIRKVRVCSVIHTYTTVYSSESHIVTREERKVRHVFGTRGGRRAALESLHCELLYLFHFSFIFSCSILTQRQQCREGKLRLCYLCVFGLLLVVWRCLYDKVSYSSYLSHYYAHSLWSEHTSRT